MNTGNFRNGGNGGGGNGGRFGDRGLLQLIEITLNTFLQLHQQALAEIVSMIGVETVEASTIVVEAGVMETWTVVEATEEAMATVVCAITLILGLTTETTVAPL